MQGKQRLVVSDCVEVRIDQNALSRNFKLLDGALQKITQLNSAIGDLSKQAAANKIRLTKQQKQIKQLRSQNQISAQFDLDDINKRIVNCQAANKAFQTKVSENDNHIRNLYDLAKHLDYDQVTRNIQKRNKFVMWPQYENFKTQTKSQINRLIKQKAGYAAIQDLKIQFTQRQQYKVFQFQVQRQLTRLERQKMSIDSGKQVQNNVEKLYKMQVQHLHKIQICDKKIQQESKYVAQMNLGDIEGRFKKTKKDIQHSQQNMRSFIALKANSSEFQTFQKKVFGMLDQYLKTHFSSYSDKEQTRNALLYIQKRLNLLTSYFQKIGTKKDQDGQALIATSRPWKCASCANNLSKYEGKIPRVKPPDTKLTPQKYSQRTNYDGFLQKLALKKLSNPLSNKSDQKLQKMQLLAQALLNVQQDSVTDKRMKQTTFMPQFGHTHSGIPKFSQFETTQKNNSNKHQQQLQRQKIQVDDQHSLQFEQYIDKAQARIRNIPKKSVKQNLINK